MTTLPLHDLAHVIGGATKGDVAMEEITLSAGDLLATSTSDQSGLTLEKIEIACEKVERVMK